MSSPIPLRRTRKPGGQDVWGEAREMAQMLNGRFGGYTIVAATDHVTSERLCAEIARIFTNGEDLYGLQGEPSWVVDAAAPNDRVHEAANSGVDGIVRVPTRPGQDLEEWAREIRRQRPRLVLGGKIAADRMAHIKALETVRVPVLLTGPVFGHARTVAWVLEKAREAGVGFQVRSIADTIEAVDAYETCDACHGFWAQMPREKLVEHYGERVVAVIDRKTGKRERGKIRTGPSGKGCSQCEDRKSWTVAWSGITWSWELSELLERDGAASLDQTMVAKKWKWTPTARNALVKVVVGECTPEVLAHPDLESDLEQVEPDHEVLWSVVHQG